MQLHYFADVKKTLYDPDYQNTLTLIRQAGVTTLWPIVWMTGRYTAQKQEIIKAKQYLESLGFATGALILPVGHPGNSLNPEETLELSLPKHWRYRVNAQGETEYFCACIEEQMLKDNIGAVKFCIEAGFTQLFYDDDLRMGNYSTDTVRGCFCPHCISEFSDSIGYPVTRGEIAAACAKKDALSARWIDYQCQKVTHFMQKTALPGIQTGIMVMQDGGRFHGIDLAAIQQAVPDCLIRVGEGHFSDAEFESDPDHAAEIGSMHTHLGQIKRKENSYSETTVFPPRALSPKNLMEKIRLAQKVGIEHIFLMSGTWVMSQDYWHTLAEYRERLDESVG